MTNGCDYCKKPWDQEVPTQIPVATDSPVLFALQINHTYPLDAGCIQGVEVHLTPSSVLCSIVEQSDAVIRFCSRDQRYTALVRMGLALLHLHAHPTARPAARQIIVLIAEKSLAHLSLYPFEIGDAGSVL